MLVHGHALGDQLVGSEQAAEHFPRQPVFLKSAEIAATLVVEHDDFGAGADLLQVAEAVSLPGHAAAVHADPETILATGLAGHAIVELPLLDASGVAPFDPFAIGDVVPIALRGQFLAAILVEACRTV